jgi:hypothetical protein
LRSPLYPIVAVLAAILPIVLLAFLPRLALVQPGSLP